METSFLGDPNIFWTTATIPSPIVLNAEVMADPMPLNTCPTFSINVGFWTGVKLSSFTMALVVISGVLTGGEYWN